MHRSVSVLIASSFAAVSSAQVAATLVVSEGDSLGGSTVDSISDPAVNGNNQVGYRAQLEDGRSVVVIDNLLVFDSGNAAPVSLSGGESSFGIGNNFEFIYSPSIDGSDGVWGQNGQIAVENVQADDFDAGFNSTFHSRPTMVDDGTAYWVSGINDGMGGTSSQERILYRQDGTTGAITGVLRAGDTFGSTEVGPFGGIDFDFSVSRDNANWMFIFNDANASSTASDGTLVVNDAVIAQEGSATGQGDNWDNFDQVDVNNAGNFIFSGDTDGDIETDEFIAYNGTIQLRQGDIVDGFTLDSFVRGASLNDNGEVVFEWDTGDEDTIFYAVKASSLTSAVALISTGDSIDIDGDGNADFIVDDFNNTDSGDIALGNDGFFTVSVDLLNLDGSDFGESLIALAVPAPGVVGIAGLAFVGATRRRRG